jgi:hypothetical protein
MWVDWRRAVPVHADAGGRGHGLVSAVLRHSCSADSRRPARHLFGLYGACQSHNWAKRANEKAERRVRNAGVSLFLALEDKWYRDKQPLRRNRQFIARDPDGYLLRFLQDIGQTALGRLNAHGLSATAARQRCHWRWARLDPGRISRHDMSAPQSTRRRVHSGSSSSTIDSPQPNSWTDCELVCCRKSRSLLLTMRSGLFRKFR